MRETTLPEIVRDIVPWASDLQSVRAAFGERPCIHDGERGLDFAGMIGRAATLAHRLRARGVAPGTPVATSLPNGIPAVWTAAALRLAGAAEVALNAALAGEERRYCLALSGAGLVLTTRAQVPAFAALGCEAIAVEDLPDAPGELAGLPPVPGDAFGRISFTSGTTGRPKAIVHTHAARWIANLLQRASWSVMPGPGSRLLLMTPFVHGAGMLFQAFCDRGAECVLLDGVDPPKLEALLSSGGIDFIFAPPTVLAKLAAAFPDRHFPGVRTVFTGTAPLVPALYAKARALFGPVVRVTYGKSEIVNPITVLSPEQTEACYAEAAPHEGVCVGFPATGVEVEIRGDTGAPCGPEEVGEVHLRARHMLRGLIDASGFRPLPPGAFHDTGDLGRVDAQGRLHLAGRMADVIKSGGYKIHPDEIERALAGTAPAVSVVALPSEYWGEVIVAVAEGADAAWPDRARAALAGLARYKHPRAFIAVEEIARNAQGKAMRRLVRERLLARYRLIDGPHPLLERR
ncbi:MAG: AMP-binding protein [Acidisphaera sp.]|nr:AMP-binding protein [Acidisphaera sp.]